MYVTKRNGFAMILAIMVVLLIASGGAYILSNVSTSSKSIGDNYLRAQAELLAQSSIEYAVMQIQGFNDESGNCLDRLNITVYNSNGAAAGNEMFDINVSMTYAFKGAAPTGTCNFSDQNTSQDTRVLIDTTVTTRTSSNLSTEPIRIQKRTWQKI